MTTTNMSLNEPSVGVTTGPDWATQVNENFETLDTHDHTSGKGVQLTPSALNINADLEFNQNSATELKNVIFDSSVTAATTSYSVYQSGGNLYWRNGSGTAVQITSGSGINTSGGSISNMTGNAQVQFSNVNNSYTFKFDSTLTDGIAKVVVSDIQLYFYNTGSATTRSVNLKYTGSGTGSNTLTVPDETGTLLSTATSFAGAISVGATGGSGSITLDAQTDINLDSDSGVINFKDGGTAIGKISNSSSDLVIENEVDAKDIIFKQYDGNEVVRMADDRRLYFFDKGGEYIVGDGTDLTIASGGALNLTATTDVVVPANVGVTFGTGEKIEGDNTDLTLTSGADINLTATADVNLPNNVGLVFGDDGEKIEGDGTDLTVASSGALNLNATTEVVVPANVAVNSAKLEVTQPASDQSGGAAIKAIGTAYATNKAFHAYMNTSNANKSLIYAENSNGEVFNVAGDGKVAIGDDSPASLLGLKGSSASATTGTAPGINLYNSGTTGDGHGSHIWFSHQKTSGKENSAAIYGLRGAGETDGDLQFAVRDNGSWVTAMHIDGADGGNVGIGTDDPRAKAEVYDSSVSGTFNATDLSTWRVLQIRNNIEGGAGTAAGIALGGDGTGDTETAGIVGISDNTTGGVCQLAFITATGNASTEHMRIDSSGNLLVGCTSMPSSSVGGSAFENASSDRMILKMSSSTTSNTNISLIYNPNGNVGSITTSGSSTSYNTSSDYRLKENVTPLTDAIDRLNQLKPSRFNFISDPDTTIDGFLAHEVSGHVPEAVTGQKDAMTTEEFVETEAVFDEEGNEITPAIMGTREVIDPQGIDQSKLVPLIVASIQELSAKVTALENA